jgi:hypothetical protein
VVVGLGLVALAMLRSSEWGRVAPRPREPELLGVSPVVWLPAAGLVGVYAFFARQRGLLAAGREPLVHPRLPGNSRLTGGLSMFFAQSLFLSVALLLAAAGIPRLCPTPARGASSASACSPSRPGSWS